MGPLCRINRHHHRHAHFRCLGAVEGPVDKIRLHARKGAESRHRPDPKASNREEPIMNPVKALEAHGQSVWLDFLARGFVAKGDLKNLIDIDGLKGVTSNPSIFEKAIGSSDEYDGAIGKALKSGDRPVAELFEQLAVED